MRWLVAVVFASSVLAGDLTGVWVGQLKRGENIPLDVAFQFTQEGSKLTGKMYGDYGSSPIVDARISGDVLTFVVVRAEQSGNEINTTRIRFAGRVQGDQIDLLRERESATVAGNSGGVHFRDRVKQTVRLKRLS